MSDNELELLRALAAMTAQYLGNGHDAVLDNMAMGAGERAFKALEKYGLLQSNNGRTGWWTEEGMALIGIHPSGPVLYVPTKSI